MDEWHWMDGKWLRPVEMKVSCFDLSILRGIGAFDFLRTYQRKPFLMEEHIERLFRSAKMLGLTLRYSKEEIQNVIHEGIRRNPYRDLYIKLILTAGESSDGITPQGNEVFYITFQDSESRKYPDHHFSKGVSLMTFPHKRFCGEAKSLNYFAAVVSLKMAKEKQANEVLYIDPETKNILEGTTVNFWAVMNGKIYTPQEDILWGITRQYVLKLCKDLGHSVHRQEIPSSWIPKFDEVFITSTTKEIMPVTKIDGKLVGNGKVGPITKQLMKEFQSSVCKSPPSKLQINSLNSLFN